MSETKKKPSAYAKLFNFFKSKAVRNVTITVLALLSVVVMFLMDEQNYFRREHLKALESNFVVNILNSIGWKRFNIQNAAWAIFGCALLVTLLLVIASTFSGVFVDKRASKNASRFKSEKSAKTFYGCAYYGVVILIAALIIFIAVMAGAFDRVFFTSGKVFLNLLLTLLICFGFMLIIPVAVFVVYSIYALIALIVYKAKHKDDKVEAENEAETTAVIAEATEGAAPATEVALEETKTVAAEETVEEPASEEVKVVAEEVSEPEVKVEEVKAEEVKPEAAAAEIAATETVEPQDEAAKFFASMEGKQFISKSFIGKMHQTDKTIQGYYGELKNYMLSFKRVRSSISWNLDTFFIGRKAVAKIGFRGKTLVMFCALDPDEYANTKYYPKDVSGVKKYEATPMMIKVKSERGVKFAKELIDVMFKGLTPIADFKPQKYNFARRTDKQLLENDLAKYI